MPDSWHHDQRRRPAELERQLAALRVENQRLRNLLKVTMGWNRPLCSRLWPRRIQAW